MTERGLADLDLPNLRFVARAIVTLGRPVIDRAWSYLTTWASLDRARVPPKLRRELLAAKLVEADTAALRAVREWSGKASLVPLWIVGDVGTGKSFAGADWLLGCRSRGRSIAWVSATELGKLPLDRDPKREADRDLVILTDELRRMAEAWAVVLDDLGGGQLNAFVLGKLKDVLLERAEKRPTLVLLNENEKDGREWIKAHMDPRLADRMRSGHGGTAFLQGKKSLRRDPDEDDIDDLGRGRAWKAANALIDLVGRDDERDRTNPIYGGRLEAECVLRDDGLRIAEYARRKVGVDPVAVQSKAFELADEDLRLRGIEVGEPFLERLRADMLEQQRLDDSERARLRIDPDHIRRTGEIQTAGHVLGSRERPEQTSKYNVDLPDGARLRLAAFGVTVRYAAALREFEVRYKPKGPAIKRMRNGEDLRGEIEKKHGRLLATALSEREAWAMAHELFSPEFAEPEKATA